VNGFPASYTYGQNDTVASIAAGLASALSPSSVGASSSGGTVTLTAKTTGSGTNYSLSASSNSSNGFSPSSFTASPSGANLTGGTNASVYSLALSSYAPNGDVLASNDSANGSWTYTYDPFNRLIGSNQNNGQSVYNYVYDIAGNRWQQNGQYSLIATFTGNNTTNNNRIDGRSYDADGNLLNDGTHNYTYDAENRLTQVDAGATATYIYDVDGRRVRKTVGGVSVDYLYDLSSHEITEVNSSGGWNRGEVYADDNHIATYNDGTTYFIHRDWLGTERVRSNVPGVACESIGSLPFGDGMTTTGSCSDISPMHFTGKQRDYESGLDNFGARYNSSNIGRFMSADPENAGASKGDPESWNAYSYGGNDPVNLVDPSGTNYCRPASEVEKQGGVQQVCISNLQYLQNPHGYDAMGFEHKFCTCDTPADQAAWLKYSSGATYEDDILAPAAVGALYGGLQAGLRGLAEGLFGGARSAGEEAVATTISSTLKDASEAAAKAAEEDFKVPLKHLPGAGGNWAKFASNVDPKAVVREALTSPNAQFLPNGTDPNSFRVVTDLGKVVGSKGETVVRVVVDFSGKIWTALPVKSR
jgi:RHS repeat-associated protein